MELEQYITNQLKAYSNGYGEPEAWLYLKSGRSIEITLEQEGLTEEELFFSVRLHCTEQEFDAFYFGRNRHFKYCRKQHKRVN